MKRFDHKFHVPKIAIGSDLKAILFCFVHRIPLIFTKIDRPFFFEVLPYDFHFAFIDKPCPSRKGRAADGPRNFGFEKVAIYDQFLFLLAHDGLCPYGDNIGSIFVQPDSSELRLNLKSRSKTIISYDELLIFDPHQAEGISFEEHVLGKHFVVDWTRILKNGHLGTLINYFDDPDDDFIKEVYVFWAKKIKHLAGAAISLLTDEELPCDERNNLDFDLPVSSMKIKKMLDKHTAFRVNYDVTDRTIRRNVSFSGTFLPENVKFPQISEEEAICSIQKKLSRGLFPESPTLLVLYQFQGTMPLAISPGLGIPA